jgi:hypothetical protein
MELENIILSEVSKFRKPKATCFLSYVEYRHNTNRAKLYVQTYIQNKYPKVGLVEETKGEGKEGKKASE